MVNDQALRKEKKKEKSKEKGKGKGKEEVSPSFLEDASLWMAISESYASLYPVRRVYKLALALGASCLEELEEGLRKAGFRRMRTWQEAVKKAGARQRAKEEEIKKLLSLGVFVLPYSHPNFPEKLKDMDDPPFLIYAKGDLSLLNKTSFGMVGSRKCTPYGRRMTQYAAKKLAQAGHVVVSGLAYGIDSWAHRSALDVGGKTLAVLGNGLFHYYPAVHRPLQDKIGQEGLLISEYRPKQSPERYHFPERNRLIAGLSDRLLVMEAGQKSGSLITALMALEEGKDVYALPGDIDRQTSRGCNKLLEDGAFLLDREEIDELAHIEDQAKKESKEKIDKENMDKEKKDKTKKKDG